jgi:hypothetical protein
MRFARAGTELGVASKIVWPPSGDVSNFSINQAIIGCQCLWMSSPSALTLLLDAQRQLLQLTVSPAPFSSCAASHRSQSTAVCHKGNLVQALDCRDATPNASGNSLANLSQYLCKPCPLGTYLTKITSGPVDGFRGHYLPNRYRLIKIVIGASVLVKVVWRGRSQFTRSAYRITAIPPGGG